MKNPQNKIKKERIKPSDFFDIEAEEGSYSSGDDIDMDNSGINNKKKKAKKKKNESDQDKEEDKYEEKEENYDLNDSFIDNSFDENYQNKNIKKNFTKENLDININDLRLKNAELMRMEEDLEFSEFLEYLKQMPLKRSPEIALSLQNKIPKINKNKKITGNEKPKLEDKGSINSDYSQDNAVYGQERLKFGFIHKPLKPSQILNNLENSNMQSLLCTNNDISSIKNINTKDSEIASNLVSRINSNIVSQSNFMRKNSNFSNDVNFKPTNNLTVNGSLGIKEKYLSISKMKKNLISQKENNCISLNNKNAQIYSAGAKQEEEDNQGYLSDNGINMKFKASKLKVNLDAIDNKNPTLSEDNIDLLDEDLEELINRYELAVKRKIHENSSGYKNNLKKRIKENKQILLNVIDLNHKTQKTNLGNNKNSVINKSNSNFNKQGHSNATCKQSIQNPIFKATEAGNLSEKKSNNAALCDTSGKNKNNFLFQKFIVNKQNSFLAAYKEGRLEKNDSSIFEDLKKENKGDKIVNNSYLNKLFGHKSEYCSIISQEDRIKFLSIFNGNMKDINEKVNFKNDKNNQKQQ